MSNTECRMSKEGILSIFIDSKDRAQRFQPSLFCGSIFDILRFAVQFLCFSNNQAGIHPAKGKILDGCDANV